jgi:hypothetical protein
MRRALRTAAVSIVVLLAMCTIVSVEAQTPDNGQGSANIIVQNMDTNTGNPDATVVVSYLDPDGSEADSMDVTVPPLAAKEFLISDTSMGEPWIGSAIVYSDSPLASVVNLLYEGGASPDDKTAAAYTGFAETDDLWYLPFVFVIHTRQVGQISVQNADEEVATVCIGYYKRRQSVPTAEVCEDIEAGGSRFYDLGTPGGNVPDLAGLIGSDRWSGSAVVEAQDGKQITVVLVNQVKNSKTMAYMGVTEPSATLIAPRLGRRARYTSAGTLLWKKYGFVQLQNPNDSAATVDLSFYSVNGVLEHIIEDLVMDPYGSAQLNLNTGGDVPASEFDSLDYDPGPDIEWEGGLVVESDLPIAGMVIPDFQDRGAASMYNLIDPAQGSNAVYAPATYRVACGSSWCPVSALSIINVSDPAQPAELNFYFYDRDGNLDDTVTRSIGQYQSTTIYTQRTGYDATLGSNWMGSVYVTSTQPIAGVVDTMWSDTLEQSSYNAIND